MTDAGAALPKLEAVLETWLPRFLANGIDYLDVRRTLAQVADWDGWADAWEAAAARYERLGEEALAAGHDVTAAAHLSRAALTLQFAQFVLTEDPARRETIHRRQAALYARAAPLLDPPAERVAVPFEETELPGYLRLPQAAAGRPGLVVLIPGLESTKEQFSSYEPYFLERGLATLSFEGPGQGESRYALPFADAAYGRAVATLAAFVGGLEAVDARRVAVFGSSFGGYLALRHAARFPGLRAVVETAGPYDLDRFAELPPVTRESFVDFVGAADEQEAAARLADVSLDGALDDLDAPVLVVHGGRDGVIRPVEAERIVAALGPRAELRLEPEGNHSCNNLAPVIRPAVADWIADRIGPID